MTPSLPHTGLNTPELQLQPELHIEIKLTLSAGEGYVYGTVTPAKTERKILQSAQAKLTDEKKIRRRTQYTPKKSKEKQYISEIRGHEIKKFTNVSKLLFSLLHDVLYLIFISSFKNHYDQFLNFLTISPCAAHKPCNYSELYTASESELDYTSNKKLHRGCELQPPVMSYEQMEEVEDCDLRWLTCSL